MQLRTIAELIDCELLTESDALDRQYTHAFGSDLMSDVLAYLLDDTLLLTGLVNHQVIRTAEMLDLKAVIFVRDKRPSPEVIQLANENGITLLTTKHTMYTASGILYANGIRGV